MISALSLLVMVQSTPALNPVEVQPGLFVLSGSPDAATLAQLKPLGITHVINLRHPSESNFSSDLEAVRSSGAAYLNCPLDREPTFTELDSFRGLMSSLPSTAKALVHCATGNRAAAALFAYWALDRGLPPDDALALAKKAGLRNAATEMAVRVYVAARQPRIGTGRTCREDSPE